MYGSQEEGFSDEDGALSVAELLNGLEHSDLHLDDEGDTSSLVVDSTGRVTDRFLRTLDEEEGEASQPIRHGFTATFHKGPRRWKSADSKLLRMEENLQKKYAPIDNLIQQKRLCERITENEKKEARFKQQMDKREDRGVAGRKSPQIGVITGNNFLSKQHHGKTADAQMRQAVTKQGHHSPSNAGMVGTEYAQEPEEFSSEYTPSPSGENTVGDAVAAATYAVISGKDTLDQYAGEMHEPSNQYVKEALSLQAPAEASKRKRGGRKRGRRMMTVAHPKSRSLSASRRHPNQPISPSPLSEARMTNARFQIEEQKEAYFNYRRDTEAKMKKLKLRIEGQTRAIRTLEHQLSMMADRTDHLSSENTNLKRTVKNSRITSKDVSYLRNAKDNAMAFKRREEDLKLQVSECQRLLKEFRLREKRAKESSSENKRLLLKTQKDLRLLQSQFEDLQKKYQSMKKEFAEARKGSKANAKTSERQKRMATELAHDKELYQREAERLRAKLAHSQEERQGSLYREKQLEGQVAQLQGRMAALQEENSRLRDKVAVAEMRSRSQTIIQQAARRFPESPGYGDKIDNQSCPPNPETLSQAESDASDPVFYSSSARDFGTIVQKKEKLRHGIKAKSTPQKYQHNNQEPEPEKLSKQHQQRSESPNALNLVHRIKKELLSHDAKQEDLLRSKSHLSLESNKQNRMDRKSPASREPLTDDETRSLGSISQRYHQLQSMYERVHRKQRVSSSDNGKY